MFQSLRFRLPALSLAGTMLVLGDPGRKSAVLGPHREARRFFEGRLPMSE